MRFASKIERLLAMALASIGEITQERWNQSDSHGDRDQIVTALELGVGKRGLSRPWSQGEACSPRGTVTTG
jgi:hypothetical protein